ncbi:hypothetical protein FQN54_009047 [Arachnomyces sp. PD_36]|nr:hypothetical protein FQN54_009047 [Arachnomyces sp. PD_36]
MYFRTLILATAITSSTFALPAQEPNGATLQKRSVDEGEQSCHTQYNGAYSTYSVEIGGAYNIDACDAVADALQTATNYQCADNDGQFRISFDYAPESSSTVNDALTSVFPSSGGAYGDINGFNCS